jgi:hypothetical protein
MDHEKRTWTVENEFELLVGIRPQAYELELSRGGTRRDGDEKTSDRGQG